MANKHNGVSPQGIGFFGLLGVVFITLKIVGIEPIGSWSWWWVTAPLWAWGSFLFVVFFCYFLVVEITKSK